MDMERKAFHMDMEWKESEEGSGSGAQDLAQDQIRFGQGNRKSPGFLAKYPAAHSVHSMVPAQMIPCLMHGKTNNVTHTNARYSYCQGEFKAL
jgi:hypothetical protein